MHIQASSCRQHHVSTKRMGRDRTSTGEKTAPRPAKRPARRPHLDRRYHCTNAGQFNNNGSGRQCHSCEGGCPTCGKSTATFAIKRHIHDHLWRPLFRPRRFHLRRQRVHVHSPAAVLASLDHRLGIPRTAIKRDSARLGKRRRWWRH